MTFRKAKPPAEHDSRTLKLSDYSTVWNLPDKVAWQDKVHNWGMLLNDQLGDCAEAGALHLMQSWSANTGTEIVPVDAAAQNLYSAVAGYRPGNPSTDQGTSLLKLLKYWRATGITPVADLPRHKVSAFVALDATPAEVEDAIYLFGGAYIGIQVPAYLEAPELEAPGATWDVQTSNNSSIGGHCVTLLGFDRARRLFVVSSWGSIYYMTYGFLTTFCDEAYAVLSEDWISHPSNVAPSGFALGRLQADLAKVAAQKPSFPHRLEADVERIVTEVLARSECLIRALASK